MLRKTLLVAVVVALLSLLIVGTALADAAAGKTAWDAKNCKSCHGTNAEGKIAVPLAGSPHTTATWTTKARTPSGKMPVYSATQVTDQELADMLLYMKTLTAPASFTVPTYTPAATDHPGKVLYNQKECVACHGGADPTTFMKTRFTDAGRPLTSADVIKQLRTPLRNMPAFSATQVTDAEAGQIADWFNVLLKAAPATTAAPAAAAPAPAAAAPAAATTAAPAALPKSGDQSPLSYLVLAGLAFVAVGAVVRKAAKRSV